MGSNSFRTWYTRFVHHASMVFPFCISAGCGRCTFELNWLTWFGAFAKRTLRCHRGQWSFLPTTKLAQIEQKVISMYLFILCYQTHMRWHELYYTENVFTVNIPGWRLRTQHTYSINFDLNVNKCQLASILESPSAPNSCRCHLCMSMHVESTLLAVVAMGSVSGKRNALIIQHRNEFRIGEIFLFVPVRFFHCCCCFIFILFWLFGKWILMVCLHLFVFIEAAVSGQRVHRIQRFDPFATVRTHVEHFTYVHAVRFAHDKSFFFVYLWDG